MAALLPKKDYFRAAVNSYLYFQKEYWFYAEPGKCLTLWAGYRDKAEEILEKIEDEVEYTRCAELLRQADEEILAEGYKKFRLQDFALLQRQDIPKERWWWWLDEVKKGKIGAKPGPVKSKFASEP
ncbi:MAG: hypothetical protein V2G48_01425 [bacterium JZ-2024 1]